MREVDVPGVTWGVRWRTNTALAVLGLLSWAAQLITERMPSPRHPEAQTWHVWAGFAVLCVVIGGPAIATWRAAREDRGDVRLIVSMHRLRQERSLCGIGALFTALFGVIVLGLLSEGAATHLGGTVMIFLTLMLGLGVWLLFQAPLVAVDPARGELISWPVGAWLPFTRRFPRARLQAVVARRADTQYAALHHLVLLVEGRKEVILDVLQQASEHGVAQRRAELERLVLG
ncbi:MAG: hypothetical protein ACOZQL_30430 [Myxococcota bacterium]